MKHKLIHCSTCTCLRDKHTVTNLLTTLHSAIRFAKSTIAVRNSIDVLHMVDHIPTNPHGRN